MYLFKIKNKVSGLELGIFLASNEASALDALARDAGYVDYDHIREIYGPDAWKDLMVEMVGEVDENSAITITIAPTRDVVILASNILDNKKGTWLDHEVPASAAPRLARLQKIATTKIRDIFPGATVVWSAHDVHVRSGQYVYATIDDDDVKRAVEALVTDIVDRTIHKILRKEV